MHRRVAVMCWSRKWPCSTAWTLYWMRRRSLSTTMMIDPQAEALLAQLDVLTEAGKLRRLSAAFARFIASVGVAPPQLMLACALLSELEGRGHSCLMLAELAGDPCGLMGWTEEEWAAVRLAAGGVPKTAAAWRAVLAVAEQVWPVGDLDFQQPLVLDGERLYLRRYWRDETAVAQSVRARAYRLRHRRLVAPITAQIQALTVEHQRLLEIEVADRPNLLGHGQHGAPGRRRLRHAAGRQPHGRPFLLGPAHQAAGIARQLGQHQTTVAAPFQLGQQRAGQHQLRRRGADRRDETRERSTQAPQLAGLGQHVELRQQRFRLGINHHGGTQAASPHPVKCPGRRAGPCPAPAHNSRASVHCLSRAGTGRWRRPIASPDRSCHRVGFAAADAAPAYRSRPGCRSDARPCRRPAPAGDTPRRPRPAHSIYSPAPSTVPRARTPDRCSPSAYRAGNARAVPAAQRRPTDVCDTGDPA